MTFKKWDDIREGELTYFLENVCAFALANTYVQGCATFRKIDLDVFLSNCNEQL